MPLSHAFHKTEEFGVYIEALDARAKPDEVEPLQVARLDIGELFFLPRL